MARLTLPEAGTVVWAEGDLESSLRSAGWVDMDSTEQSEAAPEKPKRGPGRPKKSVEAEDE